MWAYVLSLIALIQGGWMIFDGQNVLRTGKYFGPDVPGPWRHIPQALGIDPFSLGPLFLALGAVWILLGLMVAFGNLMFWAITATAMLSLLYLPMGTVLSLAVLMILWSGLAA